MTAPTAQGVSDLIAYYCPSAGYDYYLPKLHFSQFHKRAGGHEHHRNRQGNADRSDHYHGKEHGQAIL
jgi:hypothetical protein